MLLRLDLKAWDYLSKIIFGYSFLLEYPKLNAVCEFEIEREGKWLNFQLPFNCSLYQEWPLLLLRRIYNSIDAHTGIRNKSILKRNNSYSLMFFNLISNREEILKLLRLSKALKLGFKLKNSCFNNFFFVIEHPLDLNLINIIECIVDYFSINYRTMAFLPGDKEVKISPFFMEDLSLLYEGLDFKKSLLRLEREGVIVSLKNYLSTPYYLEIDEEGLYDHLNSLMWREINLLPLDSRKRKYLRTIERDLKLLLIAKQYFNLHPFPLQEKGFLKLKERELFLSSNSSFEGKKRFFYYFETLKNNFFVVGIVREKKVDLLEWSNFKKDLLDIIDSITGSYRSYFRGKEIFIDTNKIAWVVLEELSLKAVVNMKKLSLISETFYVKNIVSYDSTVISYGKLLPKNLKGRLLYLDQFRDKTTINLRLWKDDSS